MRYSIELHSHLQCPHCQKWLTLADTPIKLGQPLMCPQCGNISVVSEIKNGKGEEVVGLEWIRPVPCVVGECDRIIVDDDPTID